MPVRSSSIASRELPDEGVIWVVALSLAGARAPFDVWSLRMLESSLLSPARARASIEAWSFKTLESRVTRWGSYLSCSFVSSRSQGSIRGVITWNARVFIIESSKSRSSNRGMIARNAEIRSYQMRELSELLVSNASVVAECCKSRVTRWGSYPSYSFISSGS